MTAQKPEQRAAHARPRVPAEAASADSSNHGPPPMSELLASCAAAAAVSRPPRDEVDAPAGEQADRD
ncbi:hypothetical protein ACTWQF_04495 [Streptomyces sp. 8N114]|uniref:hypothetical protein n=1 Tax=Streptomyces sp. 8N114 TaxID=3457419 RepID=UPI003FD5294C